MSLGAGGCTPFAAAGRQHHLRDRDAPPSDALDAGRALQRLSECALFSKTTNGLLKRWTRKDSAEASSLRHCSASEAVGSLTIANQVKRLSARTRYNQVETRWQRGDGTRSAALRTSRHANISQRKPSLGRVAQVRLPRRKPRRRVPKFGQVEPPTHAASARSTKLPLTFALLFLLRTAR